MNKHAYLIMAHDDLPLLNKLISSLDDKTNDLFIHIDRKSAIQECDLVKTKASNVKFLKELNIYWGHYSQIECELLLLDKATTNNQYMYYHLLSGHDFPIKSIEYINSFFEKHNGKEFIHYTNTQLPTRVKEYVQKYHIFQKYLKISSSKLVNSFFLCLEKTSICIQKVIGLRRTQIEIQKGANWFSITHNCALYTLSQRSFIEKHFRYCRSSDEMFLQTVIYNSSFKEKLFYKGFDDNYKGCMRLIDWERGSPYTFTKGDYEQIIRTPMLFARKFSTNIDSDIINKLFNEHKEKHNLQ